MNIDRMHRLTRINRRKVLLELAVRTSTERTNLLELTGCTNVLGLTGRPGLLLTVHTNLLKLTDRAGFRASPGRIDLLELT